MRYPFSAMVPIYAKTTRMLTHLTMPIFTCIHMHSASTVVLSFPFIYFIFVVGRGTPCTACLCHTYGVRWVRRVGSPALCMVCALVRLLRPKDSLCGRVRMSVV